MSTWHLNLSLPVPALPGASSRQVSSGLAFGVRPFERLILWGQLDGFDSSSAMKIGWKLVRRQMESMKCRLGSEGQGCTPHVPWQLQTPAETTVYEGGDSLLSGPHMGWTVGLCWEWCSEHPVHTSFLLLHQKPPRIFLAESNMMCGFS